ncbi:MAG: zinc/iron-chelating domain-containing protein [Deltaproteobacteria bacterium]|nr:MAG: zinc/iron-chelating domain-containing protein [Deltaproteobacteria bacterium]
MSDTDTLPKNYVDPVRLGPDSAFTFRCHKGVPCFTDCCRKIHIVLTPYDIIRLKNRLGMTSEEFLAQYTTPELLEKTDLPVVTLKLLDDARKSCPFVRDGEGCTVYEDRPTTCRYYPAGVGTLEQIDGADGDEFYFLIKEPRCKGFNEDTDWTVAEWRRDQGVDIHDEINAIWTDILVRKRSWPPNAQLSEQAKKMFFTASYNIDKFKLFVSTTSFLQLYGIDDATVKAIREDEVELMKFGLRWLKWVMFKIGDFTINPEAARARQEIREADRAE